LHAGFAVPRYKREWHETLDFLTQSGTLLFASAYDETEEISNRIVLNAFARGLPLNEARVLHSGPSVFGALQGQPGLGKLHYAATCMTFARSKELHDLDGATFSEEDGLDSAAIRGNVLACMERFAERFHRI